MSSAPWYARYPQDFIMGTMGMPLETRGAYSILLDLIYDRSGPIPDDAGWLAGILGVSKRKWNSIRKDLIKAGKIISEDGFISNVRAVKEIENRAKTSRKHAENGANGGRTRAENERLRNENNDLDEAGLKPHARAFLQSQLPNKEITKERAVAPLPDRGKYAFTGKVVLLTHEDFDRWAEAYPGVDVRAECQRYDDWLTAPDTPAEKRKGWFPRLSNILAKKNDGSNVRRLPTLPPAIAAFKDAGAFVAKEGEFWRCGSDLFDDTGKCVGF